MTQDKAHPTPPAVPIEPRGCPTPGACSSIAAIAERAAVLEEAAQVALRLCDHRPPDQVADAIRRLAAPVASNTTAEPAPIQPAGVEAERDAARYRWLKAIYTAANFDPASLDLGDKGVVLMFVGPDDLLVSADLDEMIDDSRALAGGAAK
jgi:hypothetical protein